MHRKFLTLVALLAVAAACVTASPVNAQDKMAKKPTKAVKTAKKSTTTSKTAKKSTAAGKMGKMGKMDKKKAP